MAERLIKRACDQFRKEISSDEEDRILSTASLDDVKLAIGQIERQLAATQRLRNLGRIMPFIDALERFSKALEVACNGTDFLPWIWAVQDHTHALDRVLSAYADIGSRMPRFSIYLDAFREHQSFQHLIAFLFEDIIEFHRKAYSWITKPGFSMFFSSVWGRFDDRFGTLLLSISRTSEQIDREAIALDIMQAVESRRKSADECIERDRRHQTEQVQSIQNWLELTNTNGEMKLELLLSRHLEGTSDWATQNPKIRSWLQCGRGEQVLWLNGKPGSGKSVLCAQLIRFLRSDPNRKVCFFFCDFQTPSHSISTHILRSIASQILHIVPDAVPYIYNEYVGKPQPPAGQTLKRILQNLFSLAKDLRLVIDGIDEIAPSEHQILLKDLLQLTKAAPNLKLLLVSQDISTISKPLSKQSKLRMSDERSSIEKDLTLIVRDSLEEIIGFHGDQIGKDVLGQLERDILKKAEGMYLWVRLVMDLLQNASSVYDLLQQVHELPSSLKELYARILNNITSRCSANDLSKIRRLFAWLICNRGKQPLSKQSARLGMILHPGFTIIERTTRPLANATDICKPLIEEGHGNSLVFVHSTVPQYLLDPDSGPFLDRLQCEVSVATGCVAQLSQSLNLLDDSNSANNNEIDIALELYALLPYAQEYWVTHLLACLQLADASQLPAGVSDIVTQVERLKDAIHASKAASGETELVDCASLEIDSSFREILSPSSVLMIARHTQKSPDTESTQPALVRSSRLYRRILRSLVVKKTVTGLPDAVFLAFKKEYGPTAFMCGTTGCEKAVSGFSSRELLRGHEARHVQPLRCFEPGCGFNDVGFRTPKELRNHARKRHPSSAEAPVPKRLRSHASSGPEGSIRQTASHNIVPPDIRLTEPLIDNNIDATTASTSPHWNAQVQDQDQNQSLPSDNLFRVINDKQSQQTPTSSNPSYPYLNGSVWGTRTAEGTQNFHGDAEDLLPSLFWPNYSQRK
ncbi:Vegetative incompatibility protein HET-E-1 [Apiospora saccharicola]